MVQTTTGRPILGPIPVTCPHAKTCSPAEEVSSQRASLQSLLGRLGQMTGPSVVGETCVERLEHSSTFDCPEGVSIMLEACGLPHRIFQVDSPATASFWAHISECAGCMKSLSRESK